MLKGIPKTKEFLNFALRNMLVSLVFFSVSKYWIISNWILNYILFLFKLNQYLPKGSNFSHLQPLKKVICGLSKWLGFVSSMFYGGVKICFRVTNSHYDIWWLKPFQILKISCISLPKTCLSHLLFQSVKIPNSFKMNINFYLFQIKI